MSRLIAILGIVAAAAAASACTKTEGREARPAQPVRVQPVVEAPPPGGVRYSVTIEPFEQVTLAFKASGYVEGLLRRPGADGRPRAAQAGDLVTRGTVLARVLETDYRERIAQGRARLAETDAALVKARLDLERAKRLFDAESLTKPDLDSAQASHDAAAARVAAARSDIELAESALRDTALVAPADAVILERRIEVGSLASAGTVGFVLGDVRSVKARFGIPDSTINAVALGRSVAIGIEAVDARPFAGKVTAIAPAADAQSRVFDVEVTIPNADGRLRPGMIGTVALDQASPLPADGTRPLTVPLTAVVRSEAAAGGFAVFVVESKNGGAIARVRQVELGEVIGNAIAIRGGVTSGEHVVTSGATLLVDGDPVRVRP